MRRPALCDKRTVAPSRVPPTWPGASAILWQTANGPRPFGTTEREINYRPPIYWWVVNSMAKPVSEMSDDEILAEINKLQSMKPPQSAPKSQPKRLDEKKLSKTKRTWRDELFDD